VSEDKSKHSKKWERKTKKENKNLNKPNKEDEEE